MKYKKALLASGFILVILLLLISVVLIVYTDKPRSSYNQAVIDLGLASFEKDGYKFTIKSGKNGFTINADPIIPGKTGVRHFFTDESEIIRWSIQGPATAESPILEEQLIVETTY